MEKFEANTWEKHKAKSRQSRVVFLPFLRKQMLHDVSVKNLNINSTRQVRVMKRVSASIAFASFKLKAVSVLKAIEGRKTEGTEADGKIVGQPFEALI